MTLTARAIPMLSDNYAWLLTDISTGTTALVDPAEAAPAVEVLTAQAQKLDFIFLTHHHADHIGGVPELVAAYHPQVVGNAADANRLPQLDIKVHEGSVIALGASSVQVMEVSGHTLGHIAYYIAGDEDGVGLLLCGDTLFSLGCGRLFEGSAEQMFAALAKFKKLPANTLVCAGHEYTQANAKFAQSVDPDNEALKIRISEVTALRAKGLPTLPVTLGQELACNPFLRANTLEEFTALRRAKDQF